MSLLNLSTIPARRKELEQRVQTLTNSCDQITQFIGKLKLEAQSYIYDINKCDPRVLKELYLSHMKKLDEYLYLVSDINTLLENSETSVDNSLDLLPNVCSKFRNPRPESSSLFFDALNEPSSSNGVTSSAKFLKREDPRKALKDDCLIYFSSASTSCADLTATGVDDPEDHTNSDEDAGQHENVNDNQVSSTQANNDDTATHSVPFIGEFPDMPAFHCPDSTENDNVDSVADHIDEVLAESAIANVVAEHNPELVDVNPETEGTGDAQGVNIDHILAEGEIWNFREMLQTELPIQCTLDTNVQYPAVITAINNLIFSIIIDSFDELNDITNGMNAYYNNVNNHVNLSRDDIMSMKFCACGDETSNTWGRAFIVRASVGAVDVFFVDSGEKYTAGPEYIQPLHKDFYKYPPLSRSCQMAQLESIEDNTDMISFIDDQLSQFLFKPMTLQIEDDDTEFLAVILDSPTHGCLNEVAVRLATGYFNYNLGSTPSSSNANIQMALPTLRETHTDIDEYPQHDDPLVAVTGYHNRDEADICRIYNGNPERGCHKLNCRKRHERMHPNGWTLDRQVVVAKHNVLPLPEPGTVIRVNVTAVWHCNIIYVHIITGDNTVAEPPHPYGSLVPPRTLLEMCMRMNNPASLAALERLPNMPAPGELVVAMYIDHKWYRARVIMTLENRVKIMFVDYGTVLWVDSDNIRKLEAVYTMLPFQAVKARLVGYQPTISMPEHMAHIKRELQALIMDRDLNAQVVSRSFDEIDINLSDDRGVSIAERLYDMNLVDVVPYQIADDANTRCQVLPG